MLDWKDGQPYSDRFGDVYFSTDSGLEEKRHVFLQGNQLQERFAALSTDDSFCIGETGFGTGLNFLCAWQLFERSAPVGATLDFFSVEKFPLSDDELSAALALWPELNPLANGLLARWHRRVPGWNRWSFAEGRVRLTLMYADVDEALPQLPAHSVDAWFLDGFSPAKNPEMWSDAVLANIARASRNGATLATYTSAGGVRRGLQQAGFEVEKVEGFGRKREMTCGRMCHTTEVAIKKQKPSTAIVIGGGIAGCAAAHALVQRGINVTLIERAPELASAASGNPRGILHARFGAGGDPLHRFVLAAYGHALGLMDDVLPVDGEVRAECGLLQLACKPVETKRISRLAELEWPEHLMRFVDAEQASQLAGVEMRFGGLWFPAGGWVVPPKLCAALVEHEHIDRRLGHDAQSLENTKAGWRVNGVDAQGLVWNAEADVVLVCCAHSAKKLAQFEHFPLIPVRGQISLVSQTEMSQTLQSVVCGDGYCAPAVDEVHVMGATHAFDDESSETRSADHADNLTSLSEYAPALHQALGEVSLDELQGRASVRCSAPGSTPLVGEVERGLYCSLAHGTRGLLTAGIAGEVLAAQICDQLPPLPTSILEVLAPLPRVRHKG
ncbi:MAG: bifunctional tRNA (5-methylaminomethyl-2-thiouridine)(34)-methyltransferase MnmD/FAD-dependent 5-carboxymethylaminomethyl-2-thiouridine(34) oxidoreductase MnmC [Sideroxydans sp.]|jgi:tRNA 5-methylaminomethyl-2-thiouridine biosynthesis bifunctional protein